MLSEHKICDIKKGVNFAAGRKGEATGERASDRIYGRRGEEEKETAGGEAGENPRWPDANVLWSKKSGECCPV